VSGSIIVEADDGGVATVSINRPAVRNALDWDAWEHLGEAFFQLDQDDVRAVVLRGEGTCFSAGGDVTTMGAQSNRVMAPAARLRLVHRVVRSVATCRAPVIAAVEGFAVGAAWGVAITCDIVIAARDAFFLAPFGDRGLVADAGLAWSLPRRTGHQRAARLLLLAERLPAEEAHTLGLVTRLSEPGGAYQDAVDVAQRIARGPSDSLALTKALMHRGAHLSLDAFLHEEHTSVALNGHGPDAQEGKRAFMEKRAPDFS
jgi:2-(1,2-epoxy-1,2-dihydrophenyl)acetyl-CoA isomerase